MNERSLLIIEGFRCNYECDNEHVYRILAILEDNGVVFKGIGISNEQCDLNNYNSVINYLLKQCTEQKIDALIAGSFDEQSIQYTCLLAEQKVTYGKFYQEGGSFLGRERVYKDGRLRRDLERVVTKYSNPIKFNDCPELFEAVEATLFSQRKNSTWQGIQCAVDCMTPIENTKTLILTSAEIDL